MAGRVCVVGARASQRARLMNKGRLLAAFEDEQGVDARVEPRPMELEVSWRSSASQRARLMNKGRLLAAF
jgi:hypothetical protein